MSDNPTPAIALNVYLVSYGYQADVLVDGKEVWSQTRDFAGDHSPAVMRATLLALMVSTVQAFHNEPEGENVPDHMRRRPKGGGGL